MQQRIGTKPHIQKHNEWKQIFIKLMCNRFVRRRIMMRDGSKNDDNNKAVRKSKNATATITITTIKVKITSDLRTTFEAKLFNQPADRHTHADTHVGRQTNRPRRPVEPAARACRNSQRISEAVKQWSSNSGGGSVCWMQFTLR